MNKWERMIASGGSSINPKDYPWIVPPPGFRPTYRPGGPVQISGAPGKQTLLETIKVMPGYKGWIKRMGLESGDWDQVGFQIFIGGAPADELGLIRTPIGSPSTPEDVYIEVNPNMPVEIYAINLLNVAGPVPVRYYLGGWMYREGQ